VPRHGALARRTLIPGSENPITASSSTLASHVPGLSEAPTSSSPSPASGPSFRDLGLPAALVKALAAAGITTPYPIQTRSIPDALAGRDLLARGRTGSGKTYAFVLPLLARLRELPGKTESRRPRALVLAPTRELAQQINAVLAPLARALSLTSMTVYGGTPGGPQIKKLRTGVDIVVACPGRLEDHLRSGHVDLRGVVVTVLDEADHMADLGFLPVVRRLLQQTPSTGQRLLFSATLDGAVNTLAQQFMSDPVRLQLDTADEEPMHMDHHVFEVERPGRLKVLIDLASTPGRTLVFTRTKRGAMALTRQLKEAGVSAVELHGNLSQSHRARNLAAFAGGRAGTLVATDIAARGIHVDDIRLVVHADPPAEHKAYLHRSGRTARAGASGTVITLADRSQLRDVHALARKAGISPTMSAAGSGRAVLSHLGEPTRDRAPVVPSARGVGAGASAHHAPSSSPRRRRPRGRRPASSTR
jgi:superfamily II DNA/RNA helicase